MAPLLHRAAIIMQNSALNYSYEWGNGAENNINMTKPISNKATCLTMREKLARELKSTVSGKLFQILTIRSLNNFCRTTAELRFLYNL